MKKQFIYLLAPIFIFAHITLCFAKGGKTFFTPFSVGIKGSIALTKFITPNNDRRNDTFVFRCYNPRDLHVRGAIYDLKGRLVAKMRNKDESSADNYTELAWDPNQGTEKTKGGVYVYRVTIGTQSHKGTVIVIR